MKQWESRLNNNQLLGEMIDLLLTIEKVDRILIIHELMGDCIE
jgi:hypothetical protein